MKDFQDFLKLLIEADDEKPFGPGPGPVPGIFVGRIEDAKSPKEAFQAYSKEYKALLGNTRKEIEMALGEMGDIRRHLIGTDKGFGSEAAAKQKLTGRPQMPTYSTYEPTYNPSLVDAMRSAEPGTNPGGKV